MKKGPARSQGSYPPKETRQTGDVAPTLRQAQGASQRGDPQKCPRRDFLQRVPFGFAQDKMVEAGKQADVDRWTAHITAVVEKTLGQT